jgi:hypothetical protein
MEDKLTEFEEREEMKNWDDIEQDFIIDISRSLVGQGIIGKCLEFISRADIEICTLNDRKFLDEVKGKAKLISENVYVIYREPNKIGSVIFAKDFDANLSELVEGKQ